MGHIVFISYASRDKGVADTVCRSLEKDGLACWIAPRDVPLGVEYADAIIEALNTCQVFLVILSEESNDSPQVRREVERAVSKDLDILTLRIDNAILSKAMEYYLSSRHWLDASHSVLSKQLHSLSEAIQRLVGPPSPPESVAVIAEPPELPVEVAPLAPKVDAGPAEAPPPGPPLTAKKRRLGWAWALALILVLAPLSYFGWKMKDELPFLQPPTATRTLRPTEDRNTWVHDFAEPILAQVAGRTPDFSDDFSYPAWTYSHWGFFEEAKIENGQMVIAVTDQWHGLGINAASSNFVAVIKLNSTVSSSQSLSFGFSFRGGPDGAYNHFTVNSDGWCGFGVGGPGTGDQALIECPASAPDLNLISKITIILQGDRVAGYINDQPVISLEGLLHAGNDITIGASVSEGTAEVFLNGLEIWYLDE